MAITQWPTSERPREKLLSRGAGSLSDAELLAIFLQSGVPGKTAVDLGRDLLNRFGGLRPILTAEKNALCCVSGIGLVKYVTLMAAVELGRRHQREKLEKRGSLSSPSDVSNFLLSALRDRSREIFSIIYLDNRHQVLNYEEIFQGTLNGASVHPREVVKKVLHHNAAAVILAHNHPSGVAEPSQSDTAITRKLKEALNLIDVNVLDHLVIGDGEYVSLSERGLL